MIVSIIIMLIVALIVIAVWVSAVQQHKEKQEAQRRQELAKQKKIIEETEEVLVNSVNIPLSNNVMMILYRRIHDALAAMVELSPSSKELKSRLNDAKTRLTSGVDESANMGENFALPDHDKQLISLIQGIKKLRTIMRSEHSKGKIDTPVFMQEDKTFERLQLKINIESQIKRGVAARNANMVGSARQYFEKAYATITALNYSDDYVTNKKNQLEDYLNEISSELKASNASARKKREEEEKDDLDVLFAPKKKW
ncbi:MULTISPECIES: hypothetical protein [Pseudoalteromonas]|uniref:Membrane protein n=1 Tax=Pseudoalteromonas ruthenica TaxID=151081 RepID=A0A0F4Q0J8_9GAMM|nr:MULTISPECIES: hypothetical protein [Pseudoalteromonas]KJZ00700.1 membrane protein [Pseudoalteromonas ruthenica]KJZ01246.1 membrane protein [Pseudoalteromonas ruthenica]MCG7543157.1 hypothetical protein [Pseudoalteromonas sp. MM17-2]MCG7566755.1 hypothetical protein [Pseudoalteromonas sp. CnMc7-15]RZF79821.1 hypothetical protein EXT46_13555 [Pseudoalteromonas sp. CO325X]